MLKKILIAAVMAAPLAAHANVIPATFDTAPLPGPVNFDFNFDKINFAASNSTIVVTDSNLDSALSVGDTFTESGTIAAGSFTSHDGFTVSDTGLNTSGGYELFAVFNSLVGSVTTANYVAPFTLTNPGPIGSQVYSVNFTAPSLVNIYYDTTIGGGLSSGATLIGQASLPVEGSHCNVAAITFNNTPFGQPNGSCSLDFVFNDMGTTGVWTAFGNGTEMDTLGDVTLHVDMNLAFGNGFFSPVFTSQGGSQTVVSTNTGAAYFVSEPSVLALMGLGLLGLGAFSRRRK